MLLLPPKVVNIFHILLVVPLFMLLGFNKIRAYEEYMLYVALIIFLYHSLRLYQKSRNNEMVVTPLFHILVVFPILLLLGKKMYPENGRWLLILLAVMALISHVVKLMK
jgi:hypothetical protein